MKQRVQKPANQSSKPSGHGLIRYVTFIFGVTSMFILGFYSLFLAYTYAGKAQTFTTDNLLRTAAPSDNEKIETALGSFLDKDIIFVVLDTSSIGINPALELSAMSAAKILADSGLTSSVRILYPEDNDFAVIVAQNDISRFPAVLAVKKEGGIIQITDDQSEEYLLFAYHSVWGKTSDCSDDKLAVY